MKVTLKQWHIIAIALIMGMLLVRSTRVALQVHDQIEARRVG